MAIEGATIFLLLLVKHCIIDLFFQSFIYYKTKKSKYLSLPAHFHYIQHGIFTSLVCLFFVHWSIAIVVGLIDYIAHWHIDYSKSKVKDYFGVKVPEKGYWFLSSIDQGLHYLTYYAIVLLIT